MKVSDLNEIIDCELIKSGQINVFEDDGSKKNFKDPLESESFIVSDADGLHWLRQKVMKN